jgi:hypothetical protein
MSGLWCKLTLANLNRQGKVRLSEPDQVVHGAG